MADIYVDESLKLQPGDPYAMDTKAAVLIRKGEMSTSAQDRQTFALEAERLLGSIENVLPPQDRRANADFQVHKGRIVLLFGDSETAQATFVRALQLDPSNADARKTAPLTACHDRKPGSNRALPRTMRRRG